MKSFNNCQTFHRELSSLEEDFARLSCADDKYFQTPDIVHVLPSSANVMQSFCAKSRSKDEDRDSIKQSPKHQARNCEDIPNYPIITIVPYYGRVNHLKIFLENFRLLMSRDEMLYLVISTIGRDVKTVNETIIRIFSAADVSRIFIVSSFPTILCYIWNKITVLQKFLTNCCLAENLLVQFLFRRILENFVEN